MLRIGERTLNANARTAIVLSRRSYYRSEKIIHRPQSVSAVLTSRSAFWSAGMLPLLWKFLTARGWIVYRRPLRNDASIDSLEVRGFEPLAFSLRTRRSTS